MAQVIQCDVCGTTEKASTPPKGWGYVFRPISYSMPTSERAEAEARQKKDLCEACSSALERVLDELRRRLQKDRTVSSEERQDVVKTLLAHGEER